MTSEMTIQERAFRSVLRHAANGDSPEDVGAELEMSWADFQSKVEALPIVPSNIAEALGTFEEGQNWLASRALANIQIELAPRLALVAGSLSQHAAAIEAAGARLALEPEYEGDKIVGYSFGLYPKATQLPPTRPRRRGPRATGGDTVAQIVTRAAAAAGGILNSKEALAAIEAAGKSSRVNLNKVAAESGGMLTYDELVFTLTPAGREWAGR